MSEERMKYLFQRHLDKSCTPEERQELFGLSLEPGMESSFKNIISEAWMVTGEDEDIPEDAMAAIMNKIFRGRSKVISFQEKKTKWAMWKRIAVAASIILVFGIGSYFVFFNKSVKQVVVETVEPGDVEAPSHNRATITLANGQKVYLDSAANGQLAMQGKVKLVKLADGEIAYQTENGTISTEVIHNTLSNPKGSRVATMTLADGSKVWLNAGSSLTYPVVFAGKERKVSITGEAYFEVAPLSPPAGGGQGKVPFIVKKDDVEVEVLGTHFNVNAYNDEADIRVTLLEGSVKVIFSVDRVAKMQTLLPGQQSQVNSNGEIKLVRNPDIEETMAWKNGKFIFNGNDIRSVMRQLEKWYDIQVEYKGDVTKEQFVGNISRSVNILQILANLQETRTVSFEVIGKKVVVK